MSLVDGSISVNINTFEEYVRAVKTAWIAELDANNFYESVMDSGKKLIQNSPQLTQEQIVFINKSNDIILNQIAYDEAEHAGLLGKIVMGGDSLYNTHFMKGFQS